ncbi:hypothetical protein PVAND_003143 [Polypedilum vanderplanki]|uniref:Single domain-containing protein n=1 Tax=Polypedilum vanderplanki TaxID=319348 RepID=A0A9J6BT65_POLVA|nr:hypothetical protein PVAND_003143 [Polypedilum vanderplanki]
MKILLILISTIVCSIWYGCGAIQLQRIPSKAEGCVNETCGTLCSYEDHQFFPGTNTTLHRDVTCLQLTCTDDYHIIFEPCPFDYTGRCHFENYDSNIISYSAPVVYKTEVVNAEGIPVCSYEGVQIRKLETINQKGKCRELFCDENFNVIVTNCFQDLSSRCHYEGVNYRLLFPDCCGFKVCS